jgi:hypothetical protein
MRANVAVFKRDMVGPRFLPPILAVTALVKVSSLHHELGQPRDAVGNAAGFVGREMIVREADAFKILSAMDVASGTPLASLTTNGPPPSRWTRQGGGKRRLEWLDSVRTK